VIFISLFVRPAFFAALGKFHFAANNISIDCLVSGLILITLQDFVVKRGWIGNHKKVKGVKNTPDFFLDLFVNGSRNNIRGSSRNHWFRVVYDVRVTYTTDHLQDIHELIGGVYSNLSGITLVRIHVEGTGTGINNDTGQILVTFVVKGVVRGVVLVHGWSVLYSLIIGYQESPVKRGCDSPSIVIG
jgi:hypothetical protein